LIGPLWWELRLFRVVLRLSGTRKNFKIGQIFIYFLNNLLIIDFPKFDPITAAGMALVSILGQNVKIYSP
jgi:hypothetical protein